MTFKKVLNNKSSSENDKQEPHKLPPPASTKKQYEKKHHDSKTHVPRAIKFGIPGGAIFERRSKVTKLI